MDLKLLQFIFLNSVPAVQGVGSFLSRYISHFWQVSGNYCGPTHVLTVPSWMLQCRHMCLEVSGVSVSNTADSHVFTQLTVHKLHRSKCFVCVRTGWGVSK
jgi:hypothetical protein